jgi:hypothetical protein
MILIGDSLEQWIADFLLIYLFLYMFDLLFWQNVDMVGII